MKNKYNSFQDFCSGFSEIRRTENYPVWNIRKMRKSHNQCLMHNFGHQESACTYGAQTMLQHMALNIIPDLQREIPG